jgi:hypothetical protein
MNALFAGVSDKNQKDSSSDEEKKVSKKVKEE